MKLSQLGAVTFGIAALGLLAAYLMFDRPTPLQTTAPSSTTSVTALTAPPAATATPLGVASGPQTVEAASSTALEPSELPRYQGPIRDAQRAALVREALIARKAMQPSGKTMPGSSGVGNQVSKPLGDYVARTMREQFLPLATECYEALLSTHPNAAGNVALEFSVLGDPTVGGVVVDVNLGKTTTLTNAEFRSCMSESMYSVVFDAPPGEEGAVSVVQSFELSP